jgi:hypothetical protein
MFWGLVVCALFFLLYFDCSYLTVDIFICLFSGTLYQILQLRLIFRQLLVIFRPARVRLNLLNFWAIRILTMLGESDDD